MQSTSSKKASVKPEGAALSQFEFSTPKLSGIASVRCPGKCLRQAQTMGLPFCYFSYFVKPFHSPSGRLHSP